MVGRMCIQHVTVTHFFRFIYFSSKVNTHNGPLLWRYFHDLELWVLWNGLGDTSGW